MTLSNSEPLNKSLESKLRAKVRRVFAGRTHKGRKISVIVEKDQQQHKTIISPYEPTVETLTALIQSELKKQRENIRKQLPEKLPKDSNEFSDAFIRGYNRGVDQITKILDSLERSE